MRGTPRRRPLATGLIALLVLAPATPAVAAPATGFAPAWVEWIEGLFPWQNPTPAKSASDATESHPGSEPAGPDRATPPLPAGPDAMATQAPAGASGDTYPNLDPDG